MREFCLGDSSNFSPRGNIVSLRLSSELSDMRLLFVGFRFMFLSCTLRLLV
jgi:hypothetical protein